MRNTKTMTIVFLMIIALFTAACGSEPAAESDGKLQVVTTIGQVTDVVRNVGGELVAVDGLMGAGTDPHLYVASASEVDLLQNADVIFYNGLFLEAQMEEILEQIGENKPSIPVSKQIDSARLLDSEDYEDEFDPHIWFDVTLWQETVKQVRDTLSDVDPDNAATYASNADAYLAELDQLHTYVLEQVAQIPAEKRVIITAHDAFRYFGSAYGFEVMGLQGISTATEASTGDVQALADFIAENEIPAIFVESSVPIRNVEAVQAAVQDRGFNVEIGGELFSDAMGDDGTPEGTYIGMVRHNIDTIVTALAGE